jgi:predicted enzyme related to lactoylglutathione lyase
MKTPALELALVHVADIDVARAFYTEKLGLEADPEQSGPNFVLFQRPDGVGSSLALSAGDAVAPSNGIELWWYVDDADATHDDLVARGVEVASPLADMPFGRTFSIKDPSGNVLYFLQSK